MYIAKCVTRIGSKSGTHLRRLHSQIVSAGPFTVPNDELNLRRTRMSHEETTFRGILSLINDVYMPLVRDFYKHSIAALKQDIPDLIVFDIATFGAKNVADKLNIPYIVNSPTFLFELQVSALA
jgi:hypothetical protein